MLFERKNGGFAAPVAKSSASDHKVVGKRVDEPLAHFIIGFLKADDVGRIFAYGIKYTSAAVIEDIDTVHLCFNAEVECKHLNRC